MSQAQAHSASFVPAGRAPVAQQARRTALAGLSVMLALLAPTLLAWMVDERTLIGVSVWDKPLKFELSFSVHFATLLALLPLLAVPARSGRALRWSMMAATLAVMAEIAWIVAQAGRGRASHFNNSTPLEAILYPIMGLGAVTIVIGAFVMGLLILRRGRDDYGRGLRFGAAAGLVIGSVATLVVAGLMSSGKVSGPGHWIGGVHSDATGLPVFGWSTMGGDLRVPHFFATHSMQALPIAGWLADRVAPGRSVWLVGAAAAGWLALIAATFAEALMGLPLVAV